VPPAMRLKLNKEVTKRDNKLILNILIFPPENFIMVTLP